MMGIKRKIILPTVCIVVITAIIILMTAVIVFNNNIRQNIMSEIKVESDVVISQYEKMLGESTLVAQVMAADKQIIEAMQAKDMAALEKRGKELQDQTGADFTSFADTNAIVIARAHKANSYGDDISNQETVKRALAGELATETESGTEVRLSVRSGAPVYSNGGELLGVLATGFRMDTDNFVDELKCTEDSEVTVFLGDERIATTLKNEDGSRAIGTKATPEISAKVLAGNPYEGEAPILGRSAYAAYNPIKNTKGEVVGMIFTGKYTDTTMAMMLQFVLISVGVLVAALAISIPQIIKVARRITDPINEIVKGAESIAVGDVDVQLDIETNDEISVLAEAFNRMSASSRKQAEQILRISGGDYTVNVEVRSEKDAVGKALHNMLERSNMVFRNINESAKQVSVASQSIASGAQATAQGSVQQSAVVSALSTSVVNVAEQSKENAANADAASRLMERIGGDIVSGSEQMARLTEAVNDINEANKAINKVIKDIDDIAFQTNILALNAAVEAARAGEAGKGFAVVADEVRNLAAKSAEAAKDSELLISNSVEKAKFGAEIATSTAKALEEVVSGVDESNRLVKDIAQASDEQKGAMDEINTGIEQVAQVIQQNSATAEETAAGSQELNGQAQMLRDQVQQFKIKDQAADSPDAPQAFGEAETELDDFKY